MARTTGTAMTQDERDELQAACRHLGQVCAKADIGRGFLPSRPAQIEGRFEQMFDLVFRGRFAHRPGSRKEMLDSLRESFVAGYQAGPCTEHP